MQQLTSLQPLFDQYDAFIFDIWGVLHNGTQCYPGVLDTLRGLKAAGKKIGILSNSPRPLPSAADNIVKYGLLPELYDAILTSGQLTFEALQQRGDAWLQKLGHRVWHIGHERVAVLYDGLGLTRATTPADASFVLLMDVQDDDVDFTDHDHDLRILLKNKTPLICANPDHAVAMGDRKVLAAGALAEHYRHMGGDVRVIEGKPHPAIYARLLQQLGVTPSRALMIGDNLATDIAGAKAAGMASLLMLGGMYAPELGIDWGNWPTPQALNTLVAKHKMTPDYVMTQLAV